MHDNVIVKERVNASVEDVWNALTDKSKMKEWYFDIPDFELGVHNEFNFYEPGDARKYHHHGEILEIEPNAKLKHTWSYPEFSKEKTLVKWELEQDGDGTNVTLTHKGLENFEHLGEEFSHKNFEEGWNINVRESLKNYVEK